MAKKQLDIKKEIVKELRDKRAGNTASNLGMVEVFTALSHKLNNARVFLNEQLEPAWRQVLKHTKKFSKSNKLPGHTCKLGHALGMAAGSAAAKPNQRAYCIIGDGEHGDGNIWESAIIASKSGLSNLTVLINRNNIQADGHTQHVLPIEPLGQKYESFGFEVIEVDGHNIKHVSEALIEAGKNPKPTAIICHTTPGKGVKFTENNHVFRKALTTKQAAIALHELTNV